MLHVISWWKFHSAFPKQSEPQYSCTPLFLFRTDLIERLFFTIFVHFILAPFIHQVFSLFQEIEKIKKRNSGTLTAPVQIASLRFPSYLHTGSTHSFLVQYFLLVYDIFIGVSGWLLWIIIANKYWESAMDITSDFPLWTSKQLTCCLGHAVLGLES